MPRKARYGCTEPRVWTQPVRDLTPDTSLGFSVIAFAEDVLEITLVPWQKWLLIHALELRAEGGLRFRNVVILVARQNGKSTLSQVLALWWLYVCGCKTVLGTAQDLDTAEEVWEGAVEYAEETDGLREEVAKVVRVNGKKALVLSTGERYRVKAANRKAGRGLTGDRILLDELREHQSWDAWGAITKDLANSTPMLRSDGTWTTIGALTVGDRIFSPNGDPVTVTAVHPIDQPRPMYRVVTKDRRTVVASASHLWSVKDTRRSYDLAAGWETLTTEQILNRGLLRQGKELAFRIPQQHALQGLPDAAVPLPPYVLGSWLGDGTSQDGTLTVGEQDLTATRRLLTEAGASVVSEHEGRLGVWRVRLHVSGTPLRTLLRSMTLLGSKHVPDGYEAGSFEQRLGLLQGLLDTDGGVSDLGCVKFVSTIESLADSVLFLARSLGWTAWKTPIHPRCNGKDGSSAWSVTFTYREGDPIPFRLPRKIRACVANASSKPRLHTSILSIEPVPTEPSTCIAVDSDDHLFLAGRDLIPTHNTTMARADAQVWCLSNAGDMTSIVLRYLRRAAHKPLGDPDGINIDDSVDLLPSEDEIDAMAAADPELDDADVEDFAVDEDDLAIFEWSATPGCDVLDRDEWSQANPSMGYTELSERTIASAARTDPEWVFRTEVLCQWSEGGLEGPFPAGSWAGCAVDLDAQGRPGPDDRISAESRVTACLDVSWNRKAAYIAIAGHRGDGLPQIEVAGQSYGTEWIVDWFCDPGKPHRATWQVAIQVGSPAWALAQPLIDAGIDVVEWKGVEVGVGTGTFYDTVRDRGLRHLSQPTLTVAAETAAVKILGGGSAVIDRKGSGRDAAPLIAGIGALWLLSQTPAVPPPPPPPPTGVRATSTKSRHPMATAGF